MKIIASILFVLFCVSAQAKVIKLTTHNTVNFRGPVTFKSVTKAKLELYEQLKKRGSKKYPIYIAIDSPGGMIAAGESFIEFAKVYRNIHTISLFAASMASAIVEALPGKRYVTSSGVLMFHRARGQFKGQFEDGEVEESLRFIKKYVRNMENRSAKRMKMSLADYKARVVNEWWEFGQSAVDANMVDEVVTLHCTRELIDKKEVSARSGFFVSYNAVFSGCPLFQNPLPGEKDE